MTDLNDKLQRCIKEAKDYLHGEVSTDDLVAAVSLLNEIGKLTARATPAPQAAPSDDVQRFCFSSTAGMIPARSGEWVRYSDMLAAAPASLTPAPQGTASDAKPMTTDEAREYLIGFMKEHFTDKTFHRYILADRSSNGLAGDFAWQMANALRKLDAASLTQAATSEPVAWACPLNLDLTPMIVPDVAWGAECNWDEKYQPFPLYRLAAPPAAQQAPSDELRDAAERLLKAVDASAHLPAIGFAPGCQLFSDLRAALSAQQAGVQEAPRDAVDNLRGVAKMVANMLLRDKTPVREEAATDLLQAVAALSASSAVTNEDAKPLDERKEMERFNEWAWRGMLGREPIGRMHGSDAAREAWMARAALASQGVKGGE